MYSGVVNKKNKINPLKDIQYTSWNELLLPMLEKNIQYKIINIQVSILNCVLSAVVYVASSNKELSSILDGMYTSIKIYFHLSSPRKSDNFLSADSSSRGSLSTTSLRHSIS